MGTTLLALSLSGKLPVVRLRLNACASGASISALTALRSFMLIEVCARFASEYLNGVTNLAWTSASKI